jgi:uncharacterized protein (TIGR02246 family)
MSDIDRTVQEFCTRFCGRWDQHDARALAAHYSPDGVLADPFGNRAKGHAELEQLFRGMHETAARESTSTLTARAVELLSPEVALVDAEQVVRSMRAPDGALIQEMRFLTFMVLQKQGGEWRVRACRVFQPPAPPPAPA